MRERVFLDNFSGKFEHTEILGLLAENFKDLVLKLEFPEPCQPKLRISPPAKNYLLSPMMEADEPRKH